ncbi:MAG TPA: Hsp20/alpha crystallin family protein [bacterium]|jgi:HSP20 family protein
MAEPPKNLPDFFGDKMFFSDELGDMFDTHHPYGRSQTEFLAGRSFSPSADVYEFDDGIVITLEVPGMAREEIDLRVQGNMLEVRGSRNFVRDTHDEEYIRLERGFGSFIRTFEIPTGTDPKTVSANLENGVLTVKIARAGSRRNIPVETGE